MSDLEQASRARLLAAVEAIRALCDESNARKSPFIYADDVRRALDAALSGSEPDERGE